MYLRFTLSVQISTNICSYHELLNIVANSYRVRKAVNTIHTFNAAYALAQRTPSKNNPGIIGVDRWLSHVRWPLMVPTSKYNQQTSLVQQTIIGTYSDSHSIQSWTTTKKLYLLVLNTRIKVMCECESICPRSLASRPPSVSLIV